MESAIFTLMRNDPEYTGIGGYLNNENRNSHTDQKLISAALTDLRLSYQDLFLWVNSRYARHFMNNVDRNTPIEAFVEELRISIPALREEV